MPDSVAMSSKRNLFKLLLVVEILVTVFVVTTSYVPDEYWQSLEVAHKLAFGYGYLTWEWTLGIRSYLYPTLIAGIYKILEILNLDNPYFLTIAPRIVQAFAAFVAELYFFAWYKEQTGTPGKWAVVTVSTSWFWFYTVSRTLTNNVEMELTAIGLYFYPWSHKENAIGKSFLWFVGFACMIRPTAFVVWIPLCAYHIANAKHKFHLILTQYVPIALVILLLSTAVDSVVHGNFVLTWWNFIYANIFHGVGKFYGSHPFHWYLTIGLPTILGVQLVPFLLGCKNIIQGRTSSVEVLLLVTIGWTVFVLSFISHKEFRFLLPLLPMIWFITAKWLGRWSRKAHVVSLWCAAIVLVIGSLVPFGYFGHYHQRGTVDVMPYLAKAAADDPKSTNLLFLMPCHSTPLYSHLHVNVSLRFITCDPDFTGKVGYTDEAELFYNNSEMWLKKTYPAQSTLPSHVIHFDCLTPRIQTFLTRNNYILTAKYFHTHLPDGRVGANVVVHRKF